MGTVCKRPTTRCQGKKIPIGGSVVAQSGQRLMQQVIRAAFELNKKSSIQIRISWFCDRFRVRFMTLSLSNKTRHKRLVPFLQQVIQGIVKFFEVDFRDHAATSCWQIAMENRLALPCFLLYESAASAAAADQMGAYLQRRRKMNRFTIKQARIFFSDSNLPIT